MTHDAARRRTVNPPVERGSTVLLPHAAALYDHDQVTYGRSGLSTHVALAEAIAELEGASAVQLFPSGLAAVVAGVMSVVSAGDHVLAADCVYKPTRRFLSDILRRFGVAVTYFDGALPAPDVLALATDRTRLVIMESPGSLTFEFQDAPGVAALARERGVLTLIDNTWGAGVLFKPLTRGIDISVQALTKYVGGHADVFGGAVSVSHPTLAARVEQTVHDMGWSLSPDDAYLLLRGLRTLEVRLRAHGEAGLAVAKWLQTRPEVIRVLHPALPGEPGHEIWKRDYSGSNGLFGVVLRPGPPVAMEALLNSLQVFGLGFSWGGYESLAINADPQLRNRVNRSNLRGPLLRLHVGLEPIAVLQDDLARALDAYGALTPES